MEQNHILLREMIPMWTQRVGALGAAAVMMFIATELRANQQPGKIVHAMLADVTQEPTSAPSARPESEFSTPATEDEIAEPSPALPTIEPEPQTIVLERGFLFNGGLLFDSGTSGGVDCLPSYDHDAGIDFRSHVSHWPADLNPGFNIFDNEQNILVFGEETDQPGILGLRLNEGWALGYLPHSDSYNVYTFTVTPRAEQSVFLPDRGDAVGVLIDELSPQDLHGGVTYSNELATFRAQLQNQATPGSTDPLLTTVQCL